MKRAFGTFYGRNRRRACRVPHRLLVALPAVFSAWRCRPLRRILRGDIGWQIIA